MNTAPWWPNMQMSPVGSSGCGQKLTLPSFIPISSLKMTKTDDLGAGFFCAFSQKLKAKKTQALKKTQGFLGQKLNVPVVSYHFCCKNSRFDIINSRILLKVAMILQSKPQKRHI